jgi:hypothetical protein
VLPIIPVYPGFAILLQVKDLPKNLSYRNLLKCAEYVKTHFLPNEYRTLSNNFYDSLND